MSKNQRITILVGAAILICMWLFPPWIHDTPQRNYSSGVTHMIGSSAGYYFLFDTQQWDSRAIQRIDFGRLLVQSIVISAITGAVYFALRPSPSK